MDKAKTFLSVLLAITLLSACAQANDPTPGTPSPDQGEPKETEAAETEPVEIDEYGREIPRYPLESGLDFDGYKIRMLSRDEVRWYMDFGVEELTGEVVNDAIYDRNLSVQSDLNVLLTQILLISDNYSVSDAILTNYRAGDTAYDIAGLYQLYGDAPSLNGAFMNLYQVPYIDFSKPWWNQSFTDELTVDGQLYYSVGEMNLSVTATLMGVFVNQKLYLDYWGDPAELYDTVREGKWTKEEFKRIVTGTYADLNGNGKKDLKDSYGFVLDEADIGPWLPAFNIRLCTKDESGMPRLSYFTEKSVAAHEWMYDFFLEHPDVFFVPKNAGYMDMFKQDRALTAIIKFDDAATILRDMESDYGVLPMPKYDEAQTAYYNATHDNSNLTGVISNTQNPAAVGAAMELLSYYSYLNVTPAYFEVALKHKYFKDSDSAEMFDIIRDGAIVDFGQVYSLEIGGGTYSFDTTYHLLSRNQIRNKNRDIASRYRMNEQLYQKMLDSILEKYEEMGAGG